MIKIENLRKTYDRGSRHANEVLHGLSLELPDAGFVCILGPSGCGKTSFLNAVGGLDDFDSGKITIDGSEISRHGSALMETERNSSFGYIFQNYYFLGERSVAYNVYLGLHSLDASHAEKMRLVKDALRKVDMLRYIRRPVSELSGGQQQRVAIARAIARKPKVIFADEPTGNLDEENTLTVCSILKELSESSLVVMVTHEVRIAELFADRIITFNSGSVASDISDWEATEIRGGEKNTVYTEDYSESAASGDSVSVRILTAEGAPPVSLVVAVERDRIIIKCDDRRTLLISEHDGGPKIAEGARPIIGAAKKEKRSEPRAREELPRTKRRGGLSLGMIFREALTVSTSRKVRSFGIGLFVVIISLMMAIAVADVVTAVTVDEEKFITVDSHTLEFDIQSKATSQQAARRILYSHLKNSDLDFDLTPNIETNFVYYDTRFYQLSTLMIDFDMASYVELSRLDGRTLIYGRVPEEYDEIVVDRWVIEKALENSGSLGNAITNIEDFIGQRLYAGNGVSKLAPTVVGISDSGEPSIYASRSVMLAMSRYGDDVIALSEYTSLVGECKEEWKSLGNGECILVVPNANPAVTAVVSINGEYMRVTSKSEDTADGRVRAKYVVSDEYFDTYYEATALSDNSFKLWCDDKAAMLEYLEAPIPSDGNISVFANVTDRYTLEYDANMEHIMTSVNVKSIVIISVIVLSALMLYLMQRAKTREHLELIAVYRLLGVPSRQITAIFSIENLIETARYSLPTVLSSWLLIKVLSLFELPFSFNYPLWAALLTFLAVAVFRALSTVLPILRLVRLSPARLAAKYDF